ARTCHAMIVKSSISPNVPVVLVVLVVEGIAGDEVVEPPLSVGGPLRDDGPQRPDRAAQFGVGGPEVRYCPVGFRLQLVGDEQSGVCERLGGVEWDDRQYTGA